ncbi:Uncharacterized protein HKD37_05G012517 [Glycine soja]|uniref:Uncharacterized protein n=1 Tax=Glycine soja TaxID=3848 RepID=A0A445KK83_GLYSO|nr:Uncharacterized protein GmHk_05G012649 [Glycine max]RZC11349.1 hypothetical protein D0Y65_011516 [Glycine soja]
MSSIRFLWILMVSLKVSCVLSQPQKLSAYDVLMEYGFLVGLLPKGAIGYSLNRDNDKFVVYFQGACSFDIESYTLKYKSTITGVISKGRLYNLKGVIAKILLLWLNITKVSCQGNNIYFSIEITSVDFGVKNFLESPQCGCGFDCKPLPLNALFTKTQASILSWNRDEDKLQFSVGIAYADFAASSIYVELQHHNNVKFNVNFPVEKQVLWLGDFLVARFTHITLKREAWVTYSALIPIVAGVVIARGRYVNVASCSLCHSRSGVVLDRLGGGGLCDFVDL